MNRINKTLQVILANLICISLFLSIPVFADNSTPISSVEQEDMDFVRHLYKDKNYKIARQEADSYLKKYPKGVFKAEIIFIQAQIDVVNEEYESALEKYDHLIKKYPTSPFVENSLYFGGALNLQLQQDKGIQYFDLLLKKYPDSRYRSNVSFHLGQSAFRKKEWTSAEGYLKKGLNSGDISDSKRLEIQNLLAWVYYFQGKEILAKSLFFELLESKVEDEVKTRISFQMAVDAQKKGQFRKAVSWYDRQMRKWPHASYQDRSRFWMAECFYQIHKKSPDALSPEEQQQIIALYTKNLNLDNPSETLTSRYHRGLMYIALDKKELADEDFDWLQKNDEGFAQDIDLTLLRGNHYEEKKDWKGANKIFVGALEHQPDSVSYQVLLLKIVRNDYKLKDCESVAKWKKRADLSNKNQDAAEFYYYSGKCNVSKKRWKNAGNDFSHISLDSRYGDLIFSDYLDVFRKTKNFNAGIILLDSALKYPKLGSKSEILIKKAGFCTELKQWPEAVDTLEQIAALVPEKKNDPWFLLNIAKACDQIIDSFKNKAWRKKHPKIKTVKRYERKALTYYQTAYEKLPKKEKQAQLSLLEILIKRYQKKKNYWKIADSYLSALELIKDKQRRSEIKLQIAKLYLNQLNRPKKGEKWLYQLHKKQTHKANYEASTLLAELHVEQKKVTKAIKVLLELSSQPIKKTGWYLTTHFRLGELYQGKEKWHKAIKHYRLVVNDKRKSQQKQQARVRLSDIKKYLKQNSVQKNS